MAGDIEKGRDQCKASPHKKIPKLSVYCLPLVDVCQLIEVDRGRGELVWEYLFICDSGGTVVLSDTSARLIVIIVLQKN